MSSNTSKVSFSVQSNSKSSTRNLKATTHQEDDDEFQTTTKQFVTEFDPNETLSRSKPQRIIIPRKPDECRPSKKMKNLDIVLSQSNNPSDRLQFRDRQQTRCRRRRRHRQGFLWLDPPQHQQRRPGI
ncbi:hypothetical protein Dsin_030733 [Dipteronia sinensis]|uniref:Uncharacterized protein n=1 Tax=Dipteronia sinensis TaxID=43782 RepID=A0AAD9ZJY6_9ROSI|nr:hypothetical protein Dsin_030733 [Dipteronia sinensis]